MDVRFVDMAGGTPQWLSVLSHIHSRAFAALDEHGWDADAFRAMVDMPGAAVTVAVAGEEPVGFILYRTVLDEAEIITIAVLPNFQGNKIAFRLIVAMIATVRGLGVTRVFLEVREDNSRAIKLYNSLDFTVSGKRPKYYRTQSGNLVDALSLCLSI